MTHFYLHKFFDIIYSILHHATNFGYGVIFSLPAFDSLHILGIQRIAKPRLYFIRLSVSECLMQF